MSLLQRALDRAENPDAEPLPEPEAVKVPAEKPLKKEKTAALPQASIPSAAVSAPAVIPAVKPAEQHEAPRLNAIRFYETQNQAVETDIQEALRQHKAPLPAESEGTHQASTRNFVGLILLLLILSLGAVRLIAPSSKVRSPEPSAMVSMSETPQTVVVKAERPFIAKPIAQIKFLLTGITESDGAKLAVINNQVVATGDKLREGATVKSITEKRVVLELEGQQIVLNF